jgi:hypothetical protein
LLQVFPQFGAPLAPYIVYAGEGKNNPGFSHFGAFRAWYNCLFFNSLAAILGVFLGFAVGLASNGF